MSNLPLYEDLIALARKSEQSNLRNRGRYLCAYKVEGDARLRFSPLGFCNWCGKPLSGRSKYFCPPSERVVYDDSKRKDYWCTIDFTRWWTVGNPRFKRVVYIRDGFACKLCGLKPTTKNPHGLVIPDLNLLAIDHIYPYAKGGKTELDNLRVLCRRCNGKKRDTINYIPQPELNLAGVALENRE